MYGIYQKLFKKKFGKLLLTYQYIPNFKVHLSDKIDQELLLLIFDNYWVLSLSNLFEKNYPKILNSKKKKQIIPRSHRYYSPEISKPILHE